MFRPITTALALAAVIAASAAEAQERVQAGTLSCDISAGIGLIIGSRRGVSCLFTPAGPAPQEFYQGAFSKFGLDIGATAGGQMVWAVWSATTNWGPGALAGEYVGASAEASVVAGLGANVLIGGSNRAFALQPLSVQGQIGLNLALGITDLTLNPVSPTSATSATSAALTVLEFYSARRAESRAALDAELCSRHNLEW